MKKTARLIKYLASKNERMDFKAKEAANDQKEAEMKRKAAVVKPPKVKKVKDVSVKTTAASKTTSPKKKGGRKSQ